MTSATAPLPVAVRTWSDEGGNPRATLSLTFALQPGDLVRVPSVSFASGGGLPAATVRLLRLVGRDDLGQHWSFTRNLDPARKPVAVLALDRATAEALLSALRAELAPDIVASRDDALLLGVVSQLEAALYPAEVPPCASRT
mgnify:CR=1 FL=1